MSCKVCLLAGSVFEFLILSYYFLIEHNKLLFLGGGQFGVDFLSLPTNVWSRLCFMFLFICS